MVLHSSHEFALPPPKPVVNPLPEPLEPFNTVDIVAVFILDIPIDAPAITLSLFTEDHLDIWKF